MFHKVIYPLTMHNGNLFYSIIFYSILFINAGLHPLNWFHDLWMSHESQFEN